MAKYKVNCDSLDEAKKLDKRVSGKGATNVVRGLNTITGYFIEFDFAGPVESLGIGPLAIKKIKDTSVEVEGVPNGLMDTLKYACSRGGANYNKAVAEIKRLIKSGTSPLKAFDKVYAECSIDSVYKKYISRMINGLNDAGQSSEKMAKEKYDRLIARERELTSYADALTNDAYIEDDYGIAASTSFWSTRTEKDATAGRIADILLKVRDYLTHNKNRLEPEEQWEAMLPKYIEAGKRFGLNAEALSKAIDFVKTGRGNPWKDSVLRDDSTFIKDAVFENTMKRWGFIGSLDENYKKGTTYIDLDNNGVYDKARLIGYFTNMTDLEQMLKRIGAIHDSMQDSIEVGKEFKHKTPNGVEFTYKIKSKRGSGFVVETFARGISHGTTTMSEDRIKSASWFKDSTVVSDGKIVGGEGRSMDGIPYGLYQEGGRSYGGFEITSSENGLRKGVYRFYNWGGGVPFGNSATDGQFTEAQFQKLIGEGKVKLLDSVGYFGDAGDLKDASLSWYFDVPTRAQVMAMSSSELSGLKSNLAAAKNLIPFSNNAAWNKIHSLSEWIKYREEKKDSVVKDDVVYEVICNSDNFPHNEVGNGIYVNAASADEAKRKAERYFEATYKKRYSTGVGISERMLKHPKFTLEPKFVAVKAEPRNREDVEARRYKIIDAVSDSKMFKVVDKATGKTLLVKATDSMAAVQRVSSLKDVDPSSYSKQLDKIRRLMDANSAYVIFKQNGEWKGTSEENYNARIQNARAIVTFKGMRNKEDVIEYMNKYMGGMNNVRIID